MSCIKTLITVDPNGNPREQKYPLHNRWHPDVPAVAKIHEGEIFKVETMDWTGGQIKNNNDACDVKNVDLTQVHYLSGPIHVKDAEPGDLLKVEILNIEPHPERPWGFTGIFDRNNGGGFLTEYFPRAAKAIWDFEGIYAVSRHIPGIRFVGLIHPGLMGTAPSQELLDKWNQREAKLQSTACHGEHLAELPNKKGALAGLAEGTPLGKIINKTGARTIPGRENGGNCDIKNLTKGSTVYYPVYVPGAKLSVGDIHFSQGDGEISFCGAIEMAGIITLKCSIIKGGMEAYRTTNPIFETSVLEPRYQNYLTFEGFSVTEDGEQKYLDATTAYKMTCLKAIRYLTKFGYTPEQAYMILSTAPVNGYISGIVDYPNALTTLAIPVDIFTRDIKPSDCACKKDKIYKKYPQLPICDE